VISSDRVSNWLFGGIAAVVARWMAAATSTHRQGEMRQGGP